MKDSRFYFLLGFMSAMLFATVFVGCTAPLEAGSSECGDAEWNPCYVKIVDSIYNTGQTEGTKTPPFNTNWAYV